VARRGNVMCVEFRCARTSPASTDSSVGASTSVSGGFDCELRQTPGCQKLDALISRGIAQSASNFSVHPSVRARRGLRNAPKSLS
jgi:hypothetical protein